MNSKYVPPFAQATLIAIKWLLLNSLDASQFFTSKILPELDHLGSGKH